MGFRGIYHRIFPDSGYRSPLLSYQVLLVLMCVEMSISMSGYFGEVRGGDGDSYLWAMEPLSHGSPDAYRTPVYPLWLMLLGAIFGDGNIVTANQLLQIPIALIGGWFFMRVAGKFTFGHKRATFWLTALFCLMPQWSTRWVTFLQTETMALTGTVILIWWLVRDLPATPTARSAAIASVWLTLLVFLRPVLMCFIPVVAIYWIGLWRRREKSHGPVCGLTGAAVVVALIGGYIGWFHHTYGMYYMSAVSQWNNYYMLGSGCLLDPDDTANPHLREFVENTIRTARPICRDPLIMGVYGMPDISPEMPIEDIDSLITHSIATHRGEVIRLIWDRFRVQACPMPLLSTAWESPYGLFEAVVRPVMGLYFIFLVAGMIWLIYLWRHREKPAGGWLCWLMCASLAGASIIGAQHDWPRLTMPTIPAALLLGYEMLMWLSCRNLRSEENEADTP